MPATWLSHSDVEARLGVDRGVVRGLVRSGKLRGERDVRGRWLFSSSAVEHAQQALEASTAPMLRKTPEGALSAKAFELFRSTGAVDLRTAVEHLAVPLSTATQLARDWHGAAGEFLVVLHEPQVMRLRSTLAWSGTTEESLIASVEKLLHDNAERRDQRLDEARRQLADAEAEKARLAAVVAARDVRVRELEGDVAGYEKVGDTLRTSLREKRAQVAALEDEVSALRAAAAASAAHSPASPDAGPGTPASAPAVPIAA